MQQPRGIAVILGVVISLGIIAVVATGVFLIQRKPVVENTTNTNTALNLACTIDADCSSYCGADSCYQPICGTNTIGGTGSCTCRSLCGPIAPAANTNTSVSTAGWKTYTNVEHSYTLKYPSDWKNDNGSNGNPAMFYDSVSQQPPVDTHLVKGSKIEVYVENTTSTSVKEYIKTVDTDSKISSTQEIFIGGEVAIRQAGTNSIGSPYNIARLIKNNRLYTIVQYIPQANTVEEYSDQFSSLLSTFTFTK